MNLQSNIVTHITLMLHFAEKYYLTCYHIISYDMTSSNMYGKINENNV